MAIEFECPACDATIRVKEDAAGKKGRCPKCKVLLIVPELPPEDEEEALEDLEVIEPATESPSAAESSSPNESNDTSVLDIPVASSGDTLPIGTGASWSPPADTLPLGTTTDDSDPSSDVTESESPFSIVTASPRSNGRLARRSRRRSTNRVASIVAAVVGLAVVAVAGWYLYSTSGPELSGSLTGERLARVTLAATPFAPPDAVSQDDVSRVMTDLAAGGLPLKSEFISVMMTADDGRIGVSISPGPRSMAVRVPIGERPGVRAVMSDQREMISKLKQEEFRTATASFFRDFAAYLDGGPAMTRLPEYRDRVALNAAIGTVGYAVEAIVGSTPFPCVFEDDLGNCYFFPPQGTTSFQVRGRKLSNGETPLPVDFKVIVSDAVQPPPETINPSDFQKGGKEEETAPAPTDDDADGGEVQQESPDAENEP